ncbi:MAG: anthranilate synthase component I [Deltaproteobacteria bacterium]|nr:anthranilate synthase component I [Candidatus Zymogenaceae bacterium]
MLTPSFSEFKRLSRTGNLIPVYREFLADMETPVSAFRKLDGPYHAFLLESVQGGEKWGRFSFIGIGPCIVFRCRGQFVEIKRIGRTIFEGRVDDPLEKLREFMGQYRTVEVEGLPRFFGGAVGYIGYDMVRFMERLHEKGPDDLMVYDMYFMIAHTVVIFDNVKNTIKVVVNIFLEEDTDPASSYEEAARQIDAIQGRLARPLRAGASADKRPPDVPPPVSPTEKEDFLRAVARGKEYIESGDIIQVVLSRRLEVKTTADSFDLYRALRSVNPSPYLFYLKFDAVTLVGSSPEVLVRLDRGKVEIRPIAGTRPRGKSPAEDDRLARELLADPKELAEHIMLVDLGRNDLGRVSEFGSVGVKELMRVEKYSHVMHIASDIEGRLIKGKDAFDVLRAAFPAGTLTGAPKIRAMEIIDELEPYRRGPYGGSVGYIGFSGNMDMCITIRTMVIKNGSVYLQAGAGIVYDSDPEREFQETADKARGMIKAIEMATDNMAYR